MNPYQVTKDFEAALCDYTGAKYAVAVNSCSMALLLAVKWDTLGLMETIIEIPKHTYISVPHSIKLANPENIVTFRYERWRGAYNLGGTPVWDYARRFTSGMYKPGQYQCVSFASSKILGIEQGGAILHDDDDADEWFRKMRFDGRTEGLNPKDDDFNMVGYHAIMLPSIAAQGLLKLSFLPKHNEDLPDYDYPDLSEWSYLWA